MNKETADKIKMYQSAAESDVAMKAYWGRLGERLGEEVKSMEDMTLEQLKVYAAETRICMIEMHSQLEICFEMFKVQQTHIEIMAVAVNCLIKKEEAEQVDFSKVIPGKFEA